MYSGATVFTQLMQQLPWWRFQDLVDHYQGDYKTQTFRCAEPFRVTAFAQLTYRESLRDIEACLRAMGPKQNQATGNHPVVLKECTATPVSVTLLRTGDQIPFTCSNVTLSFSIPEKLKAGKVTDVVKVEFGSDFDPEPFLFKHW